MFHAKLVVLAVVAVVLSFVGSVSAQTQVYFNDFESSVGSEWSNKTRSITPVGGRRFLGEFGNTIVRLTLNNLPTHSAVTLSFDLYLIRTWDGNSINNIFGSVVGPDIWTLKIVGESTLISTTFSNVDFIELLSRQAYPDEYPGGDHPARERASENNTMGYTFFFGEDNQTHNIDSVYHLSFNFPHTENLMAFEFSASGLQSIGDESWGLDNVVVEIEQPPQITHTPITSAIQNQKLTIEFDAHDPDGELESVKVYFRTTGSADFSSIELSVNPGSSAFALEIPSQMINLAGLDYYIEVKDDDGAITIASEDGTVDHPYQICITEYGQLKIFNHETQKFVTLPCDYDFNSEYNTVVFVHGWNLYCGEDLNSPGEWIPELGKAISGRLDKKVNILAWDWLLDAKARLINCKCPDNNPYCEECDVCITGTINLADELWNHREEIPYAKIPDQARKLSLSLQNLLGEKAYPQDKSVQFVGHSLGAHVIAQCAESMVIASKSDSTKYFPLQVTCLDPPDNGWFKSLRDICSPIGSVRINRPEVYTELYDGIANFSSRKFKLFVDVPYLESGPPAGHFVYDWYIKTVSEYDVKIYDPIKLFFAPKFNQPREAALIPGSLGFSTSCLLDDEKNRPELSCFNKESMDYNYVWDSNGQEFTFQGCRSYDCVKIVAVIDDNFSFTPTHNIVGDDNGSSFVDNKLELKTTPMGKVEWQFQFDEYFTDSDSFQFDQYWNLESQAGKGGDVTEPPYAELIVSVISGDNIFVVYESSTDSQPIGETQTSAYVDMREFHGLPVTITFAFTSSDATISAVVQNITAYQWLGRNNQEPTARAGDDITVVAGKDDHILIQLSSTGSNDPEGAELQYQWSEMIDGNWFAFSNEANPKLNFSEGTHQIRICVYDDYQAQAYDDVSVTIEPYEGEFIRGDCNGDEGIDISDAVKILFFLFLGNTVDCQDACDADDLGSVTITDAIFVLQFLFSNGPIPLSPYPEQGKDPTPDALTCRR